MKIVYIGSFRLPNFDAAASRVLNNARALREAGHDVSFISWGGKQREEDKCDDGVCRVDGFPYIVTNELPQQGLSTIGRIQNKFQRGNKTKSLLRNWPNPIDVIITYNNCICRWLFPFCKRRGIKLINDITEWYAYNELNPLEWLSYAYDMYSIQKRVKNKIVISSFLDRFYSKTHNIVIPATCDASEEKWHKNLDHAKSYFAPFDGITLIYAGNPAKKDLVHNVINAVHRLAEEGRAIRFLIVGVTRENYISRYSSMIKSSNLSDSIIFLGRVSQDMIPSFYHQSDFMVLLREQTRKSNAGFPTKFAESFTSGTPVIANITSDLGNYLKDGTTGFVVPESSEEAISQILKEKVLSLTKADKEKIKSNVREAAKQLDFHTYIEPLRDFMNNLK